MNCWCPEKKCSQSENGQPQAREGKIIASYLLDCQRVNDQMQQLIYDLCWKSKDTLIVGDWGLKQLVKYTIHTEARTCTGEVMDSGYQVQSLSCSQEGQVFVTEGKTKYKNCF